MAVSGKIDLSLYLICEGCNLDIEIFIIVRVVFCCEEATLPTPLVICSRYSGR